MSNLVRLGCLRRGDLFEFGGKTYRANCISRIDWVNCTDIITHKIINLPIDIEVMKINKENSNGRNTYFE